MSNIRRGPGKPVGTSRDIDLRAAGVAARWRFELETAEETRTLGARLAEILRPGDLVVLSGVFGAGKTTFAQGVGVGLGVRGAVTSPTFVIARVHPGGRIPLLHVDAYRLSGIEEIDDLDLETSMEDAVTLVEWGGGLVERLVEEYLVVELSREDSSERRVAVFLPHGNGWVKRLRSAE